MGKAPERIYTDFEYWFAGGGPAFSTKPDVDSKAETEYIRADLYEQLQAENAALNSLIDDLIEARDEGLKTKKPLQSESNNGNTYE